MKNTIKNILGGLIVILLSFGLLYLMLQMIIARDNLKELENRQKDFASKQLVTSDQKDTTLSDNTMRHDPAQSSNGFVMPDLEFRKMASRLKYYGSLHKLIMQLGSNDIHEMITAANELAALGSKAVPTLIQALNDESIAIRGQVVFLLGRIADPQATQALIVALNDENAYIRRNAVDALAKIKNSAATTALVERLADEDTVVREHAAMALGELKDKTVTENLAGLLTTEEDITIKQAAIDSLGKLADSRATKILVQELEKHNDLTYQSNVVNSLGSIGDAGSLEALLRYLDHLRASEPEDPLARFPWEEAVRATEEAIHKIKARG